MNNFFDWPFKNLISCIRARLRERLEHFWFFVTVVVLPVVVSIVKKLVMICCEICFFFCNSAIISTSFEGLGLVEGEAGGFF